MKVSDILTLVAVLAAGTSAYFAYDSWNKYAGDPFDKAAREKARVPKLKAKDLNPPTSWQGVLKAKGNQRAPLLATLSQWNALEKKGNDWLTDENSQVDSLTKQRDDFRGKNDVLNQEIVTANGEKEKVTTERNNLRTSITDNDEKIRKLQEATSGVDPKVLKGTVEENVRRLKKAEQDLATEKQTLEAARQKQSSTEQTLAGVKEVIRKQVSGEMESNFRTTVREAYGRWGFVIIDAGGSRGVNARTKLDVMRGGTKVAQLQVTTVEPGSAACAIVAGTLADGVTIVPGDQVVVTPVASGPPAGQPPAPKGGDKPAEKPADKPAQPPMADPTPAPAPAPTPAPTPEAAPTPAPTN